MKEYKNRSSEEGAILNDPVDNYGTGSFYLFSVRNISKNYIKQVLILSKMTIQELIHFIPISIDTYKRKSDFNPNVTEKILEIEEVYRKGIDAFGESFHQWMNTENITLGRVMPKTLLINSFGIRLLLDEIGRLEHGVLA